MKFSFSLLVFLTVWNYYCLQTFIVCHTPFPFFSAAAPCSLSHILCDLLQDWAGDPCHDIWPVRVSQQPFVFVWSGASVHDEEQLSCPASGCAHNSAAGSVLLKHQMAVSVLCKPVRWSVSSSVDLIWVCLLDVLSKAAWKQLPALLRFPLHILYLCIPGLGQLISWWFLRL